MLSSCRNLNKFAISFGTFSLFSGLWLYYWFNDEKRRNKWDERYHMYDELRGGPPERVAPYKRYEYDPKLEADMDEIDEKLAELTDLRNYKIWKPSFWLDRLDNLFDKEDPSQFRPTFPKQETEPTMPKGSKPPSP